MNILVLNASPKGKASATLHTALYLEALHPEHTFEFLPVGVRIKRYEKDFAPARAALERADLVLFCYPVYTFLAPRALSAAPLRGTGKGRRGGSLGQIRQPDHHLQALLRRDRPPLGGGELL